MGAVDAAGRGDFGQGGQGGFTGRLFASSGGGATKRTKDLPFSARPQPGRRCRGSFQHRFLKSLIQFVHATGKVCRRKRPRRPKRRLETAVQLNQATAFRLMRVAIKAGVQSGQHGSKRCACAADYAQIVPEEIRFQQDHEGSQGGKDDSAGHRYPTERREPREPSRIGPHPDLTFTLSVTGELQHPGCIAGIVLRLIAGRRAGWRDVHVRPNHHRAAPIAHEGQRQS